MPENLEQISTTALVPYARNARRHSEAQIAQIAGSIREFGFVAPVVIDKENNIIAGHGRVLAAQKLGLVEVPCRRIHHLTEIQRRAYVLVDNQLALTSSWDDELLALEIEQLQVDDFDIGLLGFGDKEINDSAKITSTKLYDDMEPCFAVQIDVDSEEAQLSMIERMEGEGFKCRALRF